MKQIGNFGGSSQTVKETITKVKTSRETVTSSTTLQDDNDFSFSVKANTTYSITGVLFLSSPNSGGLKWLFTVPSGASGRINIDCGQATFDCLDIDITTGEATSSGTAIATQNASGKLSGFVTTSSTEGTLQFQWAQNTSNVTGTYLERGSTMILTEV